MKYQQWEQGEENEEGACMAEDAAATLRQIQPYVEMAKQAYSNVAVSGQAVARSRVVRMTPNNSRHSGKTDTVVHVCVLREKGSVAFVFRGTVILNLDCLFCDILTDLAQTQDRVEFYDPSCPHGPIYIAPPPIKAHRGFQQAFKQVTHTSVRHENIRLTLEDLGMLPCHVSRVWCIGHSLGGALATLCAKWCREVAFPHAEINCVSLGSPRVGNSEFAKDFNVHVANHSFRLVNGRDIVPCVPHFFTYPPALFRPYKHVSGAIYFHRDAKTGDLHASRSHRRPSRRNFGISNHHTDAYLNSLRHTLRKCHLIA